MSLFTCSGLLSIVPVLQTQTSQSPCPFSWSIHASSTNIQTLKPMNPNPKVCCPLKRLCWVWDSSLSRSSKGQQWHACFCSPVSTYKSVCWIKERRRWTVKGVNARRHTHLLIPHTCFNLKDLRNPRAAPGSLITINITNQHVWDPVVQHSHCLYS